MVRVFQDLPGLCPARVPPACYLLGSQGGVITGALKRLSHVCQEPAASFTLLTAGLINMSVVR